jgi:hypothetical protein
MLRPLSFRLPSVVVLILIVAVGLTGCGSKEEAPGPLEMDQVEFERWEIALVEMRIEKNEDFARPDGSPLAEADLPGFEGLNYYFPKPELRFKTPLVAAAGADTAYLTKRRGETVPYLRRGRVAFSFGGDVHRLDVFGPVGNEGEDYLWLPFFDSTNGKETYPMGRYLDVTVDDEGLVDLDFNYAYNPLCDYNADRYNCTLPPDGNKLPFAVEAGEKSFHGEH